MQSARNIFVNGGAYWDGPGWYWNPYWDLYGFIPGDGIWYSPFGWPFYSPWVAYGYGFGYGFGGYGYGGYGHGFHHGFNRGFAALQGHGHVSGGAIASAADSLVARAWAVDSAHAGSPVVCAADSVAAECAADLAAVAAGNRRVLYRARDGKAQYSRTKVSMPSLSI